jgi:hypothetical protein
MVAPAYMIERRPPPGEAKRIFDQKVVPAAINAAGAMEAVVELAACSIRRNPITGCCAAFLVGVVAARIIPMLSASRSRG